MPIMVPYYQGSCVPTSIREASVVPRMYLLWESDNRMEYWQKYEEHIDTVLFIPSGGEA